VYKGEWRGAPVALKKLKFLEDVEEFAKEAIVLEKLNHPNVLRV
jgi:predicted Ser/Thr protein kinase